jgi:hypothetical protein
MPVHKSQDKKGYYYQYGKQKKYYFNPFSIRSMAIARKKAMRQGRAIVISQGRHGGR